MGHSDSYETMLKNDYKVSPLIFISKLSVIRMHLLALINKSYDFTNILIKNNFSGSSED